MIGRTECVCVCAWACLRTERHWSVGSASRHSRLEGLCVLVLAQKASPNKGGKQACPTSSPKLRWRSTCLTRFPKLGWQTHTLTLIHAHTFPQTKMAHAGFHHASTEKNGKHMCPTHFRKLRWQPHAPNKFPQTMMANKRAQHTSPN